MTVPRTLPVHTPMSQWAVEPDPGGELLLDGIRLSTPTARSIARSSRQKGMSSKLRDAVIQRAVVNDGPT